MTYVINGAKINPEAMKMARPVKCRRICRFPCIKEFSPLNGREDKQVILSYDEFETIRLIDREGLSQEQCCGYLRVGRTTVQKIYGSARKKIAEALTEGLSLRISGGDVSLCDGVNSICGEKSCVKKQAYKAKKEGKTVMKIAVTYEDGKVFGHFGHTEQFKIYDVEENRIVKSVIADTNGHGHGALADFLKSKNADALICGGIGAGAMAALAEAGIKVYAGVSGDTDKAVESLLSGELKFSSEVNCNHHECGHGEEHSCGAHGCGK